MSVQDSHRKQAVREKEGALVIVTCKAGQNFIYLTSFQVMRPSIAV